MSDKDTTVEYEDGSSSPPMPVRACEACNRKKTKCDMRRPKCGLCRRTGIACSFPTTRKPPRRTRTSTSSKSQPSRGNMEWLLSLLAEHEATNSPLQERQQSTAVFDELPDSTEHLNHLQENFETNFFPESGLGMPISSSAAIGMDSESCQQQANRQQTESPKKPSEVVAIPQVPHELALHLTELFFQHIQPWLPLLHKPRFMVMCHNELRQSDNALADMSQELTLLFLGMFALAARYSSWPNFQGIDPRERATQYIAPAKQVYYELRGQDSPSLLCLQGCILLAFDAYTAELNSGGWILTGDCVRLAYDLGLAEIDSDEDDSASRSNRDHVDLEEMRRAWWLTWELDTFGSLTNRKPFAVDRHEFCVWLPLADEDWFAERHLVSAELVKAPTLAWKSLHGSQNQNPRAWFLIANHLVALLLQQVRKRKPELSSTKTEFETGFNCLKLAWPPDFDILALCPRFDATTFAKLNWVFGTHLMGTAAHGIMESMTSPPGGLASPTAYPERRSSRTATVRAVSLSQLVTRWPPEYMAAAHPFFVWSLVPTSDENQNRSSEDAKISFAMVEDTSELMIARFARRWKLADHALAACQLLRDPRDSERKLDLRRRFAAYFRRKSPPPTRHREPMPPQDDITSTQMASMTDAFTVTGQQGGQGSVLLENVHSQIMTEEGQDLSMATPSWLADDRDRHFSELYPFSTVLDPASNF